MFAALNRTNVFQAPAPLTEDSRLDHSMATLMQNIKEWYGREARGGRPRNIAEIQDLTKTMVLNKNRHAFALETADAKGVAVCFAELFIS